MGALGTGDVQLQDRPLTMTACREPWPAGPCWSPAGPAGSAWPRPPVSPGSGPGSGIVGRDRRPAPRRRRRRSARRRRPRSTCSSPTSPSQAEVRRLADEVLAAYPRLDVLVNNVGGYWATRHVTADGLERTFARQPPRAVPAHQPAARPAARQRPGARRHGLVRRAGHGPDRLRRPAGRAALQRAARLQPVQARQRHVHLRAGPPARGHRGHGQRPAPRAWSGPPSARRTPAGWMRLHAPRRRGRS